MIQRKIALLVISSALVTALVCASGVWKQPDQKSQQAAPENPTKTNRIAALGTLEPMGRVITVNFTPQPDAGNIRELFVTEGDTVRTGDLLATLDILPQRISELAEAQARVETALARLKQAEAGEDEHRIESIRAELASAKIQVEQAKRENDRSASLLESKSISAESAEQRSFDFSVAKENVERLEALLAEASNVRDVDLQVLRAGVVEAEAAVKVAEEKLKLAEIRSPQNGSVLHLLKRPGERINNEGLLELGNVERMVVVAEVYEADMPAIRVGQQAQAQLKSTPINLTGKVTEIGQRIGRRVVLDNDPVSDSDARVAEVRILLDEESSKTVQGVTNARVDVLISRDGNL